MITLKNFFKKNWKRILILLILPILLGIIANIMTPGAKKLADTPIPLWIVVIIIIFLLLVVYFLRSNRDFQHKPAQNSVQSLGEVLCYLRKGLENSTAEVWVCLIDKSWFFTLIPSIAICRSRGITINALVESSNLRRRYRLLKLLGGQVIPIAVSKGQYLFSGAVIDPHDSHHGIAIALSIKPQLGSYAQIYECPHDYYAIKSLTTLMNKIRGKEDLIKENEFIPCFEKVSESYIYERLKKIRFYKDATFSFEEVNIEDTHPISTSVQAVKVDQANALISLFKKHHWRLFEPAVVQLANGDKSLLVPPVVEEHEGTLVITEGHSRLFTLRQEGYKKVYVVVVRGVSEQPAQNPINWNKVVKMIEKKDIISAGRARHIETAAHIDVWADPSLDCNEMSE